MKKVKSSTNASSKTHQRREFRFVSKEGLIIMDDFNQDQDWIVLKTSDGGNSWSKATLDLDKGFLYISRDNKIITITNILGKIKAYTVEDLL